MIKDLTLEEITVCCGAVRLEERTNNFIDSVGFGILSGAFAYYVCCLTRITNTHIGRIATTAIVSAAATAAVFHFYGKTYIVDLDAPEPEDNGGS